MTTTIDSETPMYADEYRDAIEELGLNQVTVASLLGFSARMSRRYAAGEFPVPTTVAALLRIMLRERITPDYSRSLYTQSCLPGEAA